MWLHFAWLSENRKLNDVSRLLMFYCIFFTSFAWMFHTFLHVFSYLCLFPHLINVFLTSFSRLLRRLSPAQVFFSHVFSGLLIDQKKTKQTKLVHKSETRPKSQWDLGLVFNKTIDLSVERKTQEIMTKIKSGEKMTRDYMRKKTWRRTRLKKRKEKCLSMWSVRL